MAGNLTLPEWRLFLLSDCLKVYGNAYENTILLRASGKEVRPEADELDYLNSLIEEEQCEEIRKRVSKEWKFSGKVVDGGRGNYVLCDYCGKKEIRHQYLCVNVHNGTWLRLGSVCVGRIVHGEAKMKDKEFSKKYVSGLEAMRVQQQKADPSRQEPSPSMHQLRLEQHARIGHATKFLREQGHGNDGFYKSLENQWKAGKLLSPNQERALLSLYTNVYNKRLRDGVIQPEATEEATTDPSLDTDIYHNIP